MPECPPGTHSIFDFCPGDCNEPITAREILGGYSLPDGVIDEALMAHAHELSEGIRNSPFSMHLIPSHHKRSAANLIDPEVEK